MMLSNVEALFRDHRGASFEGLPLAGGLFTWSVGLNNF